MKILMTGSEGGVGRALRPRLARPGRTLRLLDLTAGGDGTVAGSVTDPDLMLTACTGVDAVLHLGGISAEAPWEDILDVNIHGTRTVLDAAVRAGVPRVILASSNHATGMTPVPAGGGLPADVAARPDTFYGMSKVAMEALGALYADRHGLDVVSLRIGTCFELPRSTRDLSTWLSFDDCARLVEACLAAPGPLGHRIVWGMSANTRGFVSHAAGNAIGYHPVDDAEKFAGEVGGEPEPLVGGAFTRFALGERP